MDPIKVKLQCMTRSDLPIVASIERASFEHPWTEKELATLMTTNAVRQVAKYNGQIVGYSMGVRHDRSFHLLNIAVTPEYRRSGVGRELIAYYTSKLTHDSKTSITLFVDERALEAQLFFKQLGFTAIGVLQGRFGKYDAYCMQYRLLKPGDEVLPEHRLTAYFDRLSARTAMNTTKQQTVS